MLGENQCILDHLVVVSMSKFGSERFQLFYLDPLVTNPFTGFRV